MSAMDQQQALVVAAVFLLAGAVKGVTGMGLPTLAVSLLSLWMTPLQAAAMLVVPSLATNAAQCRGPHWRELAGKLWPMWVALAAVVIWTPDLGGIVSTLTVQRLLGAVLLVYGLIGLWRPALPPIEGPSAWSCGIVGGATGLVVATTAVLVLPMVPFLQALRLGKDALVQALGLSFTVATVALAIRVQGTGELLVSAPTLLALVAALAGLWCGERLRARVSAATFQRLLHVVLIGLGLFNLLRAG